MSTWYVGGIPYSDELYHHGIKGQKWGLRRYQNDDGSLTPAGRARYGNDLGERGMKKQGLVRRLETGDWALGNKRIGERLEARNFRKAEEAAKAGNKRGAENYKRIAEMQKKRNIDREKYNSNASTGKIMVQNLLLGSFGADSYRIARQRGESRGEAAVAGLLSYVLPAAGVAAEFYKTKKNYG